MKIISSSFVFIISCIIGFNVIKPLKQTQIDKRGKLSANILVDDFIIKEAGISLSLPNDKWHRTPTPDGNPIQYFFKREPIKDDDGRNIIPAILVWFDIDTNKYHGDLDIYKKQKITNLTDAGIKIEKTLIPSDPEYPLTFKKGIFYKASYTANRVDHIMYVMYFINNIGIGFQVGMDMTANIAPKYESEFWTTIRSLRDL